MLFAQDAIHTLKTATGLPHLETFTLQLSTELDSLVCQKLADLDVLSHLPTSIETLIFRHSGNLPLEYVLRHFSLLKLPKLHRIIPPVAVMNAIHGEVLLLFESVTSRDASDELFSEDEEEEDEEEDEEDEEEDESEGQGTGGIAEKERLRLRRGGLSAVQELTKWEETGVKIVGQIAGVWDFFKRLCERVPGDAAGIAEAREGKRGSDGVVRSAT